MKSYNINELQINQKTLFDEISEYVRSTAITDTLYTVELRLFKMLLKLGLIFLREVIERHGAGKTDLSIVRDKKVLPFHMMKSRHYLSIFGEVEIRRAYYWRQGEKGVFPLDATLDLPWRKYSYLLEKWVQADIAEEPYEKVISRYAELLDIPVSKLGQENVAHESGNAFDAFYQQKPPFDSEIEGDVIGVETDSKGVRMIPSEREESTKERLPKPRRGKGDKSCGLRREAVATADFTFNPESRTPEELTDFLMKEVPKEKEQKAKAERKVRRQSGEAEPRQALNVQVAATMHGKPIAFERLAERVRKRDPTETKPIVVLMDGDPALEKELSAAFRTWNLYHRITAVILDIMHVMAYVWEVGTALHGERGSKRHVWVRKHSLAILEGRVGRVIGGLKQMVTRGKLTDFQKQALTKAIVYFSNHKHMMRYDKYLADGYPVATGLIEGTCGSLIKDRMDRSGARWAKRGAQPILNQRAVIKNGDWDDYWDFHMASEHKRLYEIPADLREAA